MKLFVSAICLLCCGNAFGQDKPIPKGEMSCVNEATGEVWSRLPSGHCYPKPIDMSNHQAGKKQLICDWNGKGWFCPTREPISNLDGKLVSECVHAGSTSGPCMGVGTGTVEGPPEKNLAVYPPYAHIDCDHVLGGCGGYKAPPLFDVPAKEWDGPDTVGSRYKENWNEPCPDGALAKYHLAPCTKKLHHETCTDKSRFLLKSEDGKSHCLNFSEGKLR